MKDAKIEYTATKGAGSSWEKGSAEGGVFTFKRNVNDHKTIDAFVGVKVDGVEVPQEYYTAEAGSVVITLAPSYLETLSVGEHKLTAMFADGDDVTVGFEVLEASGSGAANKDGGSSDASTKASTSSKTGDALPLR